MDGGGGFGDSVVSVGKGWGGCDIWQCGLGVEGEGVGCLSYWLERGMGVASATRAGVVD